MALSLGAVFSLIVIRIRVKSQLKVKLPYKKLVVSFAMGGVLWLLSFAFHQIAGIDLDVYSIAAKVFSLGLVFLFFQYLLLKSFFAGNYRYE